MPKSDGAEEEEEAEEDVAGACERMLRYQVSHCPTFFFCITLKSRVE